MSSTQDRHQPISPAVMAQMSGDSRGYDDMRGGGAPPSFLGRVFNFLTVLLGLVLIAAVATVPLAPREQAVFAICAAVVFLVVNRFEGKGVTMFLVALSLSVSMRYIYWRLTETLDFPSPIELVMGSGLVLAEIYAVITLVLGYVQTVWPLERKPMPLPADAASWPTVDVFIPTYNEPMSVVRATVLAAIAMDWPRDKLKIWLLDDGRREEFRLFADACGVGYITRADNRHAKAGNLNNALRQTDGQYVAIFDCDHIPTRAFLQLTMGWLVDQPNLAMVQTPHHFYSPDPFQRNLAAGTRVPSEGNMFYGLIQDGNDYWNAAFFCGSCAVLRRKALDSIGGFATETVTEDAHTMLKMHRKGWDSAYLRLPLAAGLATERLALHIGQRVRWARGMLQILRIDNPLFGRGLTLGQRICYLQAMGHFLFALPRVVFLTAPLAYLLLGQNIIAASPLAITAFALPHMFHSVATNSRVQRNWRHSFWSEIYETVLALFLVRVTLATLISPRRGSFNVTAKGGLLENGFFDLGAVYPNLILAFLVMAGVVRGMVSLIFFNNEPLVFQALLLNTIWSGLALIVVLAALAVGRETRQIRSRARMTVNVPVALHLPDGRVVSASTRDLSQGGGNLAADRPENIQDGSEIQIEFELGATPLMVPAQVLRWEQQSMQVRWMPKTIEEEARVVQAVFGRADAWTDWAAFPVDRPLASLWRVMVSIRGLFRPRDDQPKVPPGLSGGPSQGSSGSGGVSGYVALALMLFASGSSVAQTVVRPIPQSQPPVAAAPLRAGPFGTSTPVAAVPAPQAPVPMPGAPAAAMPAGVALTAGALTPAAPVVSALPAQPVPPPPPVGAVQPPGQTIAIPLSFGDGTLRPGMRRVVYNLRQLGAQGPLALRGTSELQGVEFGIRSDEVVTSAQLSLSGAMSPALIPEFSNVTVAMNEQYIGTIPVVRGQQNFTAEMPVSPVYFQDNNRLNFKFSGRYTPECNDPMSGLLWSTIYDTSTLTLTLERLPAQRQLARLPLPFFDSRDRQLLSLPFIVSGSPGSDTLKAAGIVASWFGGQAAFRGANFPVVSEAPADGNAVMIVVGSGAASSGSMSLVAGPTVGIIPNPNDSTASILLIAGRTSDEVVTAAMALTVGNRALGGEMTVVTAPSALVRSPYDAPNWMATNRPVKFGELVSAAALESSGYTGLLRVPFRTSPDFYTWRNRSFPMNLRYRSPPGPIIDVATSRLDVGINGIYLNSFSLAANDQSDNLLASLIDLKTTRPDTRVDVPSYDIFGTNDMQFYFDAKPLHRGDCVAIPSDLKMSVDPESTIDLSHGYRFAQMPNLQYFVSAGFPFTRMADLSETVVVLPDRPSATEVSAYLNLMGRIGAITGTPAINVTISRPDGLANIGDRDILMIGTMQRLQGAAVLLRNSAVALSGTRLSLNLPGPLDSVRRLFNDRIDADRSRVSAALQSSLSEGTTALVGAQSPYARRRSVVAILAASPDALTNAVAAISDDAQVAQVQGDLALLTAGKVTAYRVTEPYTVGTLPLWLYPSYFLRDQPYLVVILMIGGCLLLGLAIYAAMRRRAGTRLQQRPSSNPVAR